MIAALERLNFNWLMALLWLAANVLGFSLAGAMFHNFPLPFAFPPNVSRLGSFSLNPAIVGFFFGFIPALPIGFLQYFIVRPLLRRTLPLSRWWIVSVSAGMGLMHFLSDGFENARDLSLAVLVGGLLVGVIQWRLLRSQLPSSAGWTLCVAMSLAWYVGWLIGIAILSNTGLLYRPWVLGLDGQTHGTLGLTVGVTVSLSTGLLWVGLVRNRNQNKNTQ